MNITVVIEKISELKFIMF